MESPAAVLPSLSDTIARHGLDAKKSLGQHFLLDSRLTDRVSLAAGSLEGLNVIEIGPGPGGLTRSLLQAGAESVYAVEKDTRCIAALHELGEAFPGRLRVIEADAMEAETPAIAPAPRAIVANLPYNIGTALLLRWLDDLYANPQAYRFLTLMFQREVASRIAAKAGGKEYGRLSVLCQWLCDVQHEFDLPPGAFSPPPKIHSSVITLRPRPTLLYPMRKEMLEKILSAAFGQRRKMLRQSLKSLGVATDKLLESADIDGTRRAETLTVPEWAQLVSILER